MAKVDAPRTKRVVTTRRLRTIRTQTDENGAFMDVPGRVALSSTDEGIVKNSDGSVDVYFGPKAPQGHEANWVQTAPDRRWFIMFRFHATQPPVFDKSWSMGDIETLK
jgi:hypothetical protein